MKQLQKANVLQDRRLTLGYTQKEVAERAGISESFYSLIENGNRRPSVEVAKRLGDALGFDWTLFFTETSDNIAKTS